MSKAHWFLLSGLIYATPVLAASPSDFMTDAMKGDNSEIMLGRYAAQHGGSAEVREFGQMLASDHTKAKTQMAKVAGTVQVSVPSGATVEADAERVKLMLLSGRNFDKEFVEYMVKDHQSDIAKFKEEAGARDGAVSKLAEKQLPVLEKHLKRAQSLLHS